MSEKQMRPFGIKDKMGYLLGDLGNDLTFILSSSYLMKFYTDIMGVPAAAVGVIMMILMPLLAVVSTKYKERSGKQWRVLWQLL